MFLNKSSKAFLSSWFVFFLSSIPLTETSAFVMTINTSPCMQRGQLDATTILQAKQSTTTVREVKHHRRRSLLQQLSLVISIISLFSPTTAFSMSSSSSSSSIEICEEPQKVVVIGANGKTGFRVVELLKKSSNYEPVAMVREESQSERFKKIEVPSFVGDLDSSISPTVEDLEGAHTVIFAAGAGR